jgi:hypothetical protein
MRDAYSGMGGVNNCSDAQSYDACNRDYRCGWKENIDGTGVPVVVTMDTCFAAPAFAMNDDVTSQCSSIKNKDDCLGTGKCLYSDCQYYKSATDYLPYR